MGQTTPKVAACLGGLVPYLIGYMVPWAHASQLAPPRKRHLDRFSRFAGLTNVINRQTETQSTLRSL